MATFDDVARIALALPDSEETTMWGNRAWKVRGKLFVWERPLRRKELAELGDAAPSGPILGARVEHLVAKEAVLADPGGAFLTTAHFEGHASVLARLDALNADDLEELVTEAWLARAPEQLAAAYLVSRK